MPMDIHSAAVPPSANLAPAEPPAPLIPAQRLARLLKRYAWVILGCTLIAGIAAFGYAHTLPKTYTANSALAVEGSSFNVQQLQGALNQLLTSSTLSLRQFKRGDTHCHQRVKTLQKGEDTATDRPRSGRFAMLLDETP